MSEPDFDTSGKVPLRRSRFRSTFRPLGCDVCRASYSGLVEYGAEGWVHIMRCPICGTFWSDRQKSFVAVTQEDADLELAGESFRPAELPSVLDVIAEPPGDRDDDGRWTLPPLPQGLYSGVNGGKLWQVEALAFVADVLLDVPVGSVTHRFQTLHRDEVVQGMPIRMDDYGTSLNIPLDWELLVSKVDLGRYFTHDAASDGLRFVRAIGSNTRYYSARGPAEIVTTARAPRRS